MKNKEKNNLEVFIIIFKNLFNRVKLKFIDWVSYLLRIEEEDPLKL